MAKSFSNEINVGAGFALLSQNPLDARLIYDTKEDMLAMEATSLYDGLIAYVKGVGTFQYSSSNTVDAELGKWREFGAADESNSRVTIIEGETTTKKYKFGDIELSEEQYNTLITDGTLTVGDDVFAYTPASETEDATTEEAFTLNDEAIVPEVVEGAKEFAKVYKFYQGSLEADAEGKPVADEDKLIGTVNVPLDLVVSKGYCAKVYVDEEAETAWYFEDNNSDGVQAPLDYATYKEEKSLIVLHIANTEDERIIIPVSDLGSDEKEVKVYETFDDLPETAEADTLAYVKNPIDGAEVIGKFYDNLNEDGEVQEDSCVVEIDGIKYSVNGTENCAQYKEFIENEQYNEAKELAMSSELNSETASDVFLFMTLEENSTYDILSEKKPAGLFVFDDGWKTNTPEVETISETDIEALF